MLKHENMGAKPCGFKVYMIKIWDGIAHSFTLDPFSTEYFCSSTQKEILWNLFHDFLCQAKLCMQSRTLKVNNKNNW